MLSCNAVQCHKMAQDGTKALANRKVVIGVKEVCWRDVSRGVVKIGRGCSESLHVFVLPQLTGC